MPNWLLLILTPDVWYNLLKNRDLKPHFSKMQKWFEQAVMPWHPVAYLFPKYGSELLNYEKKKKGVKLGLVELMSSLYLTLPILN